MNEIHLSIHMHVDRIIIYIYNDVLGFTKGNRYYDENIRNFILNSFDINEGQHYKNIYLYPSNEVFTNSMIQGLKSNDSAMHNLHLKILINESRISSKCRTSNT